MARKKYSSSYLEKLYYDNTIFSGVLANTDPHAEGSFKHLVNFDITDTGQSITPRKGIINTTLIDDLGNIVSLNSESIIYYKDHRTGELIFIDFSKYNHTRSEVIGHGETPENYYIDNFSIFAYRVPCDKLTNNKFLAYRIFNYGVKKVEGETDIYLEEAGIEDIANLKPINYHYAYYLKDEKFVDSNIIKVTNESNYYWLSFTYNNDTDTLLIKVIDFNQTVNINYRNIASSKSLIPNPLTYICSDDQDAIDNNITSNSFERIWVKQGDKYIINKSQNLDNIVLKPNFYLLPPREGYKWVYTYEFISSYDYAEDIGITKLIYPLFDLDNNILHITDLYPEPINLNSTNWSVNDNNIIINNLELDHNLTNNILIIPKVSTLINNIKNNNITPYIIDSSTDILEFINNLFNLTTNSSYFYNVTEETSSINYDMVYRNNFNMYTGFYVTQNNLDSYNENILSYYKTSKVLCTAFKYNGFTLFSICDNLSFKLHLTGNTYYDYNYTYFYTDGTPHNYRNDYDSNNNLYKLLFNSENNYNYIYTNSNEVELEITLPNEVTFDSVNIGTTGLPDITIKYIKIGGTLDVSRYDRNVLFIPSLSFKDNYIYYTNNIQLNLPLSATITYNNSSYSISLRSLRLEIAGNYYTLLDSIQGYDYVLKYIFESIIVKYLYLYNYYFINIFSTEFNDVKNINLNNKLYTYLKFYNPETKQLYLNQYLNYLVYTSNLNYETIDLPEQAFNIFYKSLTCTMYLAQVPTSLPQEYNNILTIDDLYNRAQVISSCTPGVTMQTASITLGNETNYYTLILYEDPTNIKESKQYCIFNTEQGYRLVTWNQNIVYVSEPDKYYYFLDTMRFAYPEKVLKVLTFKDKLLVFTTMNMYAIFPYEYTTTSETTDDEGNKKQVQKTEILYNTLPVLYNIYTDEKYLDAIKVYNDIVLFYSISGQLYLITPSATIDSDTVFKIKYLNQAVNDILLNYDKYINERLPIYNLKPVEKKDIEIKVNVSLAYIKIYYSIPSYNYTYIIIYDTTNNRYTIYDTAVYDTIQDVLNTDYGEIIISKLNWNNNVSIVTTNENKAYQYIDPIEYGEYEEYSNCDRITTDAHIFESLDINTELDTGILFLNNHLKKRLRNLHVTYKNIDANEIIYNMDMLIDDIYVNTIMSPDFELTNINNKYEITKVSNSINLLKDNLAIFDFSKFTSNKIITHNTSIPAIGKNVEFIIRLSSKGKYKIQNFGLVYKEHGV